MTDQLVDPLTVAADLIDAEIERMRQRWLDHCRGRRRRPPLTRAQKKVFIVGSKDAFMRALENVDPVRQTGFRLGVVSHDD